jgi:pyrroline-5-carboxylate reductase
VNDTTIAFIGGGNMATSLIGGMTEKGFSTGAIRVSDPVEESRRRLEKQFGVATVDDNREACRNADVVVLAVKPQVMKEVVAGFADALAHRPLVISIAAGIPMAALQAWLGADKPIVRCMPNTPSLVQAGASGLYASDGVSDTQKTLATEILDAVGMTVWLESEDDLDAVTAVSGSGPAYFFLLMEAMEKAGTELGLNPETARRLTLQTALGAAKMAHQSDVDPAELRRRVSSPGGTTERAVATFVEAGLPELVARAMTAARDRSRQMAEELTRN